MAGPLSGLRVVDFSRGTAGPRAAGLLADYGADVVWVEPPGGCPWRAELRVEYAVFNRGKRSVELDLNDPGRRVVVEDLVRSADVAVQSWRPGVAERLGLGVADLRALNPRTVVCTITGFGPDAPSVAPAGYESIVQALVGTMGEQAGYRDGPIYQGLPFAAIGASYLAVIGTLAALYRRGVDGRGGHVETSLFDGALAYLAMFWSDTDDEAPGMGAMGGRRGPVSMRQRLVNNSFRCADDEYLGVHTGAVGAFARLMTLLELSDVVPVGGSGPEMGQPLTPEQADLLQQRLPEIFAARPRAEWLERLLGADICAIPHLRPGQVFDEPQPRHNGLVADVEDPELGRLEQVGPPIRLTSTPAHVRGGAPAPGQHTDEVLAELPDPTPGADPGADPSSQAQAPSERSAPLAGVRVLDIGAFYAGPYSSRLLADLGADVVKLEPIAGDPLRGLPDVFRTAQAGKRAIALNLKDAEAKSLADELVRRADVVHHNMRPGAAERLGLSYQHARELNPSVVYLYAPGWGQDGPDAARQSFAPMLSAYVGVGYETAGEFNPPLFSVGNEDPGNGLVGAVGILLALLYRQCTGEGQYVENPQLNAAMSHVAHIVRTADGSVLGAGRLDPLQFGVSALDRVYETSDGWLALAAHRDTEISALGAVIGSDILADARFADLSARADNDYELSMVVGGVLRAKPTAQWLNALNTAGVPAAVPVMEAEKAFLRDPVNHRNGRVGQAPDPVHGQVREIGHLIRIAGSDLPPYRRAPGLGAHTEQILTELGCSPDRIATLFERKLAR